MPIIPVIIEQHAENAAFNWLLRDRAVCEPHYDLSDLAQLDERVEANLDGLRIAGEPGWEICREALAWEEPGEIFAAGVLALVSGDASRMEAVLNAVGEDFGLARGLISALGWIDYPTVRPVSERLLESVVPILKYVGIASMAVHRQDPGPALKQLLHDTHPRVRARALKAVGELGKSELGALLPDHFSDPQAACRFQAAHSAALLGDLQAIAVLEPFMSADLHRAEAAARAIVRLLPHSEALGWLNRLLKYPVTLRTALVAAGALGDPGLIPLILPFCGQAELARVAGEAFTMITGADLALLNLEGKAPEGFEAGPTENAADENVAPDPDEDLPWPAPALVEQWWQANKRALRPGDRHLLGKRLSEKHLQDILRHGMQRQRASAAIELVLLRRGAPLWEVRAPGYIQQQLLGTK